MHGFRELIQLHLAHAVEREAAAKQAELKKAIAALEADLASAKATLEAAEADIKRMHLERKSAELDVQKLEDTRKKYREQLMSAKTNEIYKTLLHEIETTSAAISVRETVVLEVMEASEAGQVKVAEAKKVLAEAEGRRKGQEQRLLVDVATLEEERVAAAAHAERLMPEVPVGLLTHYMRIREKRDGRGMAVVEEHACTACRVGIRPQALVDMVTKDEMFQCVGCQRILYRKENMVPNAAAGAAS